MAFVTFIQEYKQTLFLKLSNCKSVKEMMMTPLISEYQYIPEDPTWVGFEGKGTAE